MRLVIAALAEFRVLGLTRVVREHLREMYMQYKTKLKYSLIAVALASALTVSSAQAESDGEFYAGVHIKFGKGFKPTFTLGYRHASIDNDNDVNGADISFRIDTSGGKSLLLKGFDGDECTQGELGVGYDFEGNSVLFSAGVQSHNGNGGVDYFLADSTFEGHVGYSSIGCYDPNVLIDPGYGGYGYGNT